MAGLPLLRATGLQTAHNPFTGVPEGGLGAAKNVMVFSNGVVEPRRGFRQLSYTLTSDTDLSNSGAFFGETLVVQHGSSSLSYDSGSAFTAISGTFESVDDSLLRMKFQQAKGHLFFNAASGLKVLTSTADTPTNLNLPPPRWYSSNGSENTLTGSGAWVPDDSQMAFRMTYVYTDENGVEYESAPSDRLVLVNSSGGETYPSLWWLGNSAVVLGSTVIRFYRTEESASATTDPGDEMFLFYELPASTADRDDEYNAYDFTRSTLSDVGLYTNPRTGDGILQANTRPPLSKDLVYFADRMWYANTTSRQRFFLEMLGTGAPDGVQDGDTVTINDVVYTAETGTVGAGEFALVTGGTPSENIRQTSRNLVAVINNATASGQSTVKAAQISGTNDGFGHILLEAESVETDAFTVYASRAESWNPLLTTSSTDAYVSDGNRLKNGLFFSKPDQPEAVPLLNYLPVGSASHEILRIVPLREKLFVFKADGIFTVSGQEPFAVDQLDSTTRLVCPDSVQVLNNQIYALTNQGVVSVSDAGVQILSRPIEDALLPFLSASMRPVVQRYAFGVAHETDRTYELWLPGPGVTDSRVCNTGLVYSPITQSWVLWDGSEKNWSAISPTDVRYYGSTSGKVLKERRDSASTDFCDETLDVTVSAFDDAVPSATVSSATGIEVGDALVLTKSGSSQSVTITAVDGNDLTLSEAVLMVFQTGATATVDRAFESEVRWLPVAFDRPGSLKRFQYGTLHFAKPTAFQLAYATYATELSAANSEESLVSISLGYGENEWGSTAWGDPYQNLSKRHTIPAEKQRAAMIYPGFRIREARAPWKLHGVTLDTEETSERTQR